MKSVSIAHFFESLKAQGLTWKKILVFANNILIKSEQAHPSGFVQTSFSQFHKYNVGLIMTQDNYFVNGDREPTKQEVFAHAFLVNDARYTLYSTLFADLNHLMLKNLLTIYRVENEAASIFDSLKTKSDEYAELRRDSLFNPRLVGPHLI